MKSKKGQEYIVEFVLATIILMLVFIFLKLAVLGFFDFILPSDLYVGGTVEEVQISSVCGANLVNFLRFEDNETGLTYADLIAADPGGEDTRDKIKDFFDNEYRRGNARRQRYNFFVKQKAVNLVEIVNIDQKVLDPKTCSAVIPTQKGGSVTAKLELEY